MKLLHRKNSLQLPLIRYLIILLTKGGAFYLFMILCLPKNVQINTDVIRKEFMKEYDATMKIKDNCYSSFGTKKGDWISLVKNQFAAAHFNVDNKIDNDSTLILIHEGATKIGSWIGADLWGEYVYSSFFKDVNSKFIYWLLKKYGLTKNDIKLQHEPFFKSILVLIVVIVFEYVTSFDYDDYVFFATLALITFVFFVIAWFWGKKKEADFANEIGITIKS